MLAEAVEAQALTGWIDFPIGPDFGIPMIGSPFGDIGVEAFAISHDRRQKPEVAAFAPFGFKPAGDFVARLRFDGDLAIGTKLRPEPGEQQADEMVHLSNGSDRALAAAAARALLDADRRLDARDKVHVWPRKLLDELPGINIHRIEEPSLPFGKQQIKRQRALARTANTSDDNQATPGNLERKIFEIMLSRAVNGDRVAGGCG